MLNVQCAAVHVLDRKRCEINIQKAADVYAPFVRSSPRTTKGQDSAHRTEVVGSDFCIPSVCGQRLDGCEQSQFAFTYAMYECAPPTTYRAVADPYVIKIGVDLELDLAAMAAAAVRLLHDI